MTDKELLELAAKAAKLPAFASGATGLRISSNGCKSGYIWNPLTDDGDALRLAVKLNFCLGPNLENDRAVVDAGDFSDLRVIEMFGDNKYAATRRAIVSAAAEIGRTM